LTRRQEFPELEPKGQTSTPFLKFVRKNAGILDSVRCRTDKKFKS
jgi:hypothetical protein